MPIRVPCPGCRRRLRVPENLAGCKVSCPRCGAAVLVPLADRSPTKSLAQAAAAATASTGGVVADLEHAPLGARLGAVALVFGVAAVAVLCVPVLGYASVALSGLGLLLGLGGLVHQTVAPHGAGISGGAGLFPLAGTLVCLAALLLALLPFLLRPLLVQ